MKSRIILIIVGLIVLLGIGIYGPRLYANSTEDYNEYPYMYDTEETNTYEFIYMHLSDEDQEDLDLAFMNAYKEKALTEEMTIEIVDQIKSDLTSDYDIYNEYPRYQMMGRRYGGGCHGYYNDDAYESYEWVYIHESIETREMMDQLLIDKLVETNLEGLTDEEILEIYQNIKEDILFEI